jgi:hypothetical protein
MFGVGRLRRPPSAPADDPTAAARRDALPGQGPGKVVFMQLEVA